MGTNPASDAPSASPATPATPHDALRVHDLSEALKGVALDEPLPEYVTRVLHQIETMDRATVYAASLFAVNQAVLLRKSIAAGLVRPEAVAGFEESIRQYETLAALANAVSHLQEVADDASVVAGGHAHFVVHACFGHDHPRTIMSALSGERCPHEGAPASGQLGPQSGPQSGARSGPRHRHRN